MVHFGAPLRRSFDGKFSTIPSSSNNETAAPEHDQSDEDEDVLYACSVLRRSHGERHFGYAVDVVESRNQPLLRLLLQYMCLNALSGLAGSTVRVPVPDH